MLSQSLRPNNWNEIAGQDENIRILKAIIKNPENAPKSLIFQGAYGCGKTTSARIMARELNNIKDPEYDLLNSAFYYEFDSTVVGNVEEIRKLRDNFSLSYGDFWRVIVLDECHSVSQAAQTALLKVLEEVKGKNFFILCTTHVQKMLPTIRSRSLELKFEQVSVEEVIKNLTRVEAEKGIGIPADVKEIIANRSGGHMRNAHMLLDKYVLLGDVDFKDSIKSSISLYCQYFTGIHAGDKELVLQSLNSLLAIPKDELQQDFNIVMVESMRASCGMDIYHASIKELVNLYGKDFNALVNCYMAPWFQNAFIDMPYFQAAMLQIFISVNKLMEEKRGAKSQTTQAVVNPYAQNMMRR